MFSRIFGRKKEPEKNMNDLTIAIHLWQANFICIAYRGFAFFACSDLNIKIHKMNLFSWLTIDLSKLIQRLKHVNTLY